MSVHAPLVMRPMALWAEVLRPSRQIVQVNLDALALAARGCWTCIGQ